MLMRMRRTVLLLAFLCHAAPVLSQQPRYPIWIAQPAQTPPPPSEPPPPPKPRTATPAEDTGMAGQVAEAGAAGLGAGLSTLILPGILTVLALGAVAAVSNSDNTTPALASGTTGTR